MNKRMIILIALAMLAMAGAANAGTAVDEVEIRGTVIEADGAGDLKESGSAGPYYSGYTWNPYTFGAFWYELDDDLSSEMLRINAPLTDNGRTIPMDQLIYTTSPLVQDYAYYRDCYTGWCRPIGMVSGKPVTNYSVEGWMTEKYVAISTGGSTAANAHKLSELLVEFGSSSDKKLLLKGEPWDLGEGFSLNVTYISSDGYVVVLLLEKNDEVLGETVIETHMAGDRRYMYTEDISGVSDVVVFFCYVDAVSPNPGLVQLKYVYLIDNDILTISSGDTYGNMKVKTASGTGVTLKNDGDIDLSKDADVEIMEDIYFNVADSDTVRFYPYKLYTDPGDYGVRGTVVEANYAGGLRVAGSGSPYYSGYTWDPYTFAAFWYDLDDDLCSESLSIDALLYGRTITEDNLIYTTTPQAQDYRYYKDKGPLGTVDGKNVTDYYMEGWMAEKYVAISTGGSTAANANKLAKLLVEFESSSDTKTLVEGEPWDLGGGFTLNATQIDLANDTVTVSLAKNNVTLNETIIDTSPDGDRRYMYTEDLSGVNDVVVFFCYVDAIFRDNGTNMTLLKYVYLIDNDVERIESGTPYGNMEVKTASSLQIVLRNDFDIDLSQNTDVEIMKDMCFRVADSDTVRFYPFVERTIDGTVPTPPETILADDVDGDGVPDVWDMDNSTPQDYWTDSDGIGRKWGDMNGDGKLTSVDALMILQAAAEKIDIG